MLREEMIGGFMGVLVTLAMPQGNCVTVAILQVLGYGGDAFLFY